MTTPPGPGPGPGHRSAPPGADRLRPSVLAVLVVLCVGTVALGMWGALRWSLIPVQLDGTVAWSATAKDGPPWRELVIEGGEIRTIDTDLLDRMGSNETIHGQPIRKEAWSRTLTVGDRTVRLAPSAQFWRTAAMLAALLAVAVVRLVVRFRRPGPAGDPAPSGAIRA